MRKNIASYEKIKAAVQPYNNQRGFIMGVVILLSLILLIIVTMAVWSTNNESNIVRNTGIMTQEFYDAESGLVGAINHADLWQTPEFIAGDHDTTYTILDVYSNGAAVVTQVDDDRSIPAPADNGTVPGAPERRVATVQIRHIDQYTGPGDGTPVEISQLWPESNQYPNISHIGDPSAGFGSEFRARYYTITSKDASENAVLQIGVRQNYRP